MLERRLLAVFAVAASNATDGKSTSCDNDCSAILANASMICVSADMMSNATADCLGDDEGAGVFGSYLVLWRCAVHQSPFALLFLIPWLLMLLMALGSTADNFLMPQLHYLSEMLKLSPDVAGVTLLAMGNGAPDVFSAIAVATANVNTKMDLSFMLSDIVGGCAHSHLSARAAAHVAAPSHAWPFPARTLPLGASSHSLCLHPPPAPSGRSSS